MNINTFPILSEPILAIMNIFPCMVLLLRGGVILLCWCPPIDIVFMKMLLISSCLFLW